MNVKIFRNIENYNKQRSFGNAISPSGVTVPSVNITGH